MCQWQLRQEQMVFISKQAMGGWGHLNENGAGLKKQRRVIKIWSEIMDGRLNTKQPKIPGNDGSLVDTGGGRGHIASE